MIKKYLHIIAVVVFLFSCYGLNAQVLPSLLLKHDAASLAMGATGVSAESGAYAIENNVASIAFAEQKFNVQAGFGLWQPSYANLKTLGLAGMYRLSDKLGVAMEFKYLMMPSYSGITGTGADIRDSEFKPSEFGMSVGLSYKLFDFLSAGLALRYAGSKLASDADAGVFGSDLGLSFQKDSFSAGLSLNNLGTKVKYSETAYAQPMLVKFGAGYDLGLGESDLLFTAQADYLFAGGFMAGAGCEYSFKDMIFARAGYHYGDSTKTIPSYASVGLGLKLFGVTLDAAYLVAGKSSPMKNTLSIGLGYRF